MSEVQAAMERWSENDYRRGGKVDDAFILAADRVRLEPLLKEATYICACTPEHLQSDPWVLKAGEYLRRIARGQ